MQIILSNEEIEIIYEALTTERKETLIELALSERKGRGDFDRKYLKRVEAILERLKPYIINLKANQ